MTCQCSLLARVHHDRSVFVELTDAHYRRFHFDRVLARHVKLFLLQAVGTCLSLRLLTCYIDRRLVRINYKVLFVMDDSTSVLSSHWRRNLYLRRLNLFRQGN